MMMEEEVVIEEMSMKEVMVEVDDGCICKEEERGGGFGEFCMQGGKWAVGETSQSQLRRSD